MIIDIHAHIWEENWLPTWFWDIAARTLMHRSGLSYEEALKSRASGWDRSGDTFVRSMDAAGVDRAVICVLDWGLVEKSEGIEASIEEINRATYEAVARHPGRLVLGVGVDPRRENALEIVEQGVQEYGARVVKLYPPAGFYPNDRACYPLYEKCLQLGVPVNFHTGPFYAPLYSKYSHPAHLDDVAADFPRLTIIATHTGHGWWMDMVAIARMKRNIFCDLAAWQDVWLTNPVRFYKILRYMMDMVGPGRMIFGSDWSGTADTGPYASWVGAFTQIPPEVKRAGTEFSEEEMAQFLGGTAARILRLDA